MPTAEEMRGVSNIRLCRTVESFLLITLFTNPKTEEIEFSSARNHCVRK